MNLECKCVYIKKKKWNHDEYQCKLVLACQDEILNMTEISLDDKKVACEKSNSYSKDFIGNYILVPFG